MPLPAAVEAWPELGDGTRLGYRSAEACQAAASWWPALEVEQRPVEGAGSTGVPAGRGGCVCGPGIRANPEAADRVQVGPSVAALRAPVAGPRDGGAGRPAAGSGVAGVGRSDHPHPADLPREAQPAGVLPAQSGGGRPAPRRHPRRLRPGRYRPRAVGAPHGRPRRPGRRRA